MAAPAPITNGNRPLAVVPVARDSNRISGHLAQTTTPGALTGGLVNIGESQQVRMVLGAGKTASIPKAGLSYYFSFIGTVVAGDSGVSDNSIVSVRALQKGQPRSTILHAQGTGLRFGTFTFSALEVVNLQAHAIFISFVVGGGTSENSYDEYIDNRVIIDATGGSSVVVTTAPGVNLSVVPGISSCVAFKTRTPAWADSLGAGATQDIADGYLGRTRRSVVIGNDDNATILMVLDAAGNILGSIQPGTSFYLETAGDIKVNNPSGVAVVCHIGEVYFT